MSAVISKWLGTHDWIHDLGKLACLGNFSTHPEFQLDWREAKRYNKQKLCDFIEQNCDILVSPEALFDVSFPFGNLPPPPVCVCTVLADTCAPFSFYFLNLDGLKVHVKRIHEYKRQFMNILSVAYR